MTIHPSIAAPAVLVAPKSLVPADVAKVAAKQAPAKNDADGDLKADLAKGENPFETLGSKVNTKA